MITYELLHLHKNKMIITPQLSFQSTFANHRISHEVRVGSKSSLCKTLQSHTVNRKSICKYILVEDEKFWKCSWETSQEVIGERKFAKTASLEELLQKNFNDTPEAFLNTLTTSSFLNHSFTFTSRIRTNEWFGQLPQGKKY
jgi:hypothetical protein